MRIIHETREALREAVRQACERAVAAGDLPETGELPDFIIETPKEKEHGEFATNLAMALARPARRAPRQIAEAVQKHFEAPPTVPVTAVEIAGPGFINFRLEPRWLHPVVAEILRSRDAYGRSDHGKGKRILVEFVSANPTGPLNVVQGRSAAFGDSLVRIFRAAGYDADREFYVNDAGNQFRKLAMAMETRLRQQLGEEAELPEGAYPGEYIIDLAREYLEQHGSGVLELPEKERWERLGRFAVEKIVAGQRQVLADYGVEFERWFHESEIRAAGGPEQVIELLRERGHVYEAEGALWLRTTSFGDDKDRVLRRSGGEYTYFVPDIAYHLDKFRRGYEHLIDIWGQDHHGYIRRMTAAIEALGHRPEQFEVLITQIVRLMRGGELVKVSKRGGVFVELEELLEEAGRDATRFFFLMRTLDSHMDFDLDLARRQESENPVYYVQYAHARISSILRQAVEQGVPLPWEEGAAGGAAAGGATGGGAGAPGDGVTGVAGNGAADGLAGAASAGGANGARIQVELLETDAEQDLLRRLAEYPEEVIQAAEHREPHRLTTYARELATAFHTFYVQCRVLGEAPPLTAARLALSEATRQTLANVLDLLGVSAPDRM